MTDRLEIQSSEGEVVPGAFAVGDHTTVEDRTYPATAQTADQMARYLAKQLNLEVKGNGRAWKEGFVFKSGGNLTYIGGGGSVGENSSEKGRTEWALWKSANVRLVDLRNPKRPRRRRPSYL